MGSMALVFGNPPFYFLFCFLFFWLLKDKHWHFPQRKKLPGSTKERTKGALRKDLASSTSPRSHGKPVPYFSAADKDRGPSPGYSWSALTSPLSTDLNFPSKINLLFSLRHAETVTENRQHWHHHSPDCLSSFFFFFFKGRQFSKLAANGIWGGGVSHWYIERRHKV